jgi:hypothetical protein
MMEEMVGYMNSQYECMHEWGAWKEWPANPHNDGYSHIKLHVPRLTHDSLGSSFLSTWSSFLSLNLNILGKYIIIFPWK